MEHHLLAPLLLLAAILNPALLAAKVAFVSSFPAYRADTAINEFAFGDANRDGVMEVYIAGGVFGFLAIGRYDISVDLGGMVAP